MNGAIDFFCFPEFDSPTVFASLLDAKNGGHFCVSPVLEDARTKQLYLPETNVLLTRFLSDEGVGEISDFMVIPPEGAEQNQALVRRAKTVRGEVRFRMECMPRFDYGRAKHRTERKKNEVLFTSDGLTLRLRSSLPLDVRHGDAVAEFTLPVGKHAWFVLERAEPGQDSPSLAPDFVAQSFKDTSNFWRDWMARSTYQGRWQETVRRSALVLKLLNSRRHGSLIASPTFGLPEIIGGGRNWDYRFVWIRDASFALYALIRLGYTDELGAFMRWIEARCEELGPDGQLQVLYGVDGRKGVGETVLDHFSGYKDSRPVRIGNDAYAQLQLDIYGELMDAVYLYDKYGQPISHDLWQNLVRLLSWVCDHWREPDQGLWEVRGGRHEFLFSRVMCWVAVDRGIRLATKRSLPAPLEQWQSVRDEIHRQIYENYWDHEREAFLQFPGANALDASALLMPLVRFIGPTDPRWLSTLAAIQRELVDDSLVYRYRLGKGAPDGLTGQEGTFCMCTFWLVECLARAGDLPQARLVFEKMMGYANHLGLYAEELG